MNIQTCKENQNSNPQNSLRLSGITWEQFKKLENSFHAVAGARLIYLDGVLEIVILGREHEYYKRTISLLLEAYLRKKGIRFYSQGSASLGNKELIVQKEPDESYSIGIEKSIPDLVIEVVVSSGSVNILEIYQRIGISEVWLWEDGLLKVFSLQERYQEVKQSRLFPKLDLNVLAKYIRYYDQYDAVTEFLRELSLG